MTDLLAGEPGPTTADTRTVPATTETVPVIDACDVADAAVWVNESDPETSLVVATNKVLGFVVYGLDGAVVSTSDVGTAARCPDRPGLRREALRPLPECRAAPERGRAHAVDLRGGLLAGARVRRQVDEPAHRLVVGVGVGGGLEAGERVADLRPVVEALVAGDPVRDAGPLEGGFEGSRLRVGTVEASVDTQIRPLMDT